MKKVSLLLAILLVTAFAYAQKAKKQTTKVPLHSEMVEKSDGAERTITEIKSLQFLRKPLITKESYLQRLAVSLNASFRNKLDAYAKGSTFMVELAGKKYFRDTFTAYDAVYVLKKVFYSDDYLGDSVQTEAVTDKGTFYSFIRTQYGMNKRLEGHFDLVLSNLPEFNGLDPGYRIPLILAFCGNVITGSLFEPEYHEPEAVKNDHIMWKKKRFYKTFHTIRDHYTYYLQSGDTVVVSDTVWNWVLPIGIAALGGLSYGGYELYEASQAKSSPPAPPPPPTPTPTPPTPPDTNGGPTNIDPSHRQSGGGSHKSSNTTVTTHASPLPPYVCTHYHHRPFFLKSAVKLEKTKERPVQFTFQTKVCIPIFRKTNLVEILKGISFSIKPLF